jgi:hypothetical protein
MKVSKTDSLKSIQHLASIAEARMIEGIEKYGEELKLEGKKQELLEEIENEIADIINYLAFAYIKIKTTLKKGEKR